MVVKKTKSGKFSFEVSWFLRSHIFSTLCDFLETESVNLMRVRLKTEADILRHLYYSVLNDFITRKDFQLSISKDTKWTVKRSEAIALMWLIRECDVLPAVELKSAIHKCLS